MKSATLEPTPAAPPVAGGALQPLNGALQRDTGGPSRAVARSRTVARWAAVARDLVSLTKPRVISLLLVTTLVPMLIAPGGPPSIWVVLWTLLGGYLMAGGANAINMWADRDIDRAMGRTRLRPIPAGRLRPPAGLLFGVGLGLAAFAMLWAGANPLAAALALGGLLFYVFVYTLALKRRSPQNIVIGGAAGAFPPLVGWAAATGGLNVFALTLFAIVFYWTPPHFWALALVKRRDYAAAGVPMLPVVRGEAETKRQMLAYAAILVPFTLLPVATGDLGWIYGTAAILLGARLLGLCVALVRAPDAAPAGALEAAPDVVSAAWRLYRWSLLYLAFLFAAMAADRALPPG